MSIKIRKANINDLKEIQKLNVLLFKKEQKEYGYSTLDINWPTKKEGKAHILEKINKNNNCVFIVENDNIVAGYLYGGLLEKSYWKSKPICAELESIFITEKYRNIGIGKKLYSSFLDWCKKKNVKKIRIYVATKNKRAIKFYADLGYIEKTKELEKEI